MNPSRPTKQWTKSKSVWLGIIVAAISMIGALTDVFKDNPKAVAAGGIIVGFLTIVFRALSTTTIKTGSEGWQKRPPSMRCVAVLGVAIATGVIGNPARAMETPNPRVCAMTMYMADADDNMPVVIAHAPAVVIAPSTPAKTLPSYADATRQDTPPPVNAGWRVNYVYDLSDRQFTPVIGRVVFTIVDFLHLHINPEIWALTTLDDNHIAFGTAITLTVSIAKNVGITPGIWVKSGAKTGVSGGFFIGIVASLGS